MTVSVHGLPLGAVLGVLAVHWVADFLAQSETMATRKSSSWSWLTLHVAVYTLVTVAGAWQIPIWPDLGGFWSWIGINAALHFVTDAATSRATARLYAAGRRRWFFVVVGLDQLLHQVALLVTLDLVLAAG